MTSSNVKMIAQWRPTTPVASALKQMLYNKFQGNAATRCDLSQEKASTWNGCKKSRDLLELQLTSNED